MTLGTIVRMWGAVNFEPDFMVVPRLYEAAKLFKTDFKHWQVDGTTFTFFERDDRHEVMHATVKQIGFEVTNPDNPQEHFMRMANMVRVFAHELGCSMLTRMGVKIVVYADLDLPFTELCGQVQSLCLPENDRLRELTSPDITDVAMNFDYCRDGKTVALRVGPMKKAQGVSLLHKVGGIERLYPPSDDSSQWLSLVDGIPDSFLYFDADTYLEDSSELQSWSHFAEEAINNEVQLYKGIKDLVLECG